MGHAVAGLSDRRTRKLLLALLLVVALVNLPLLHSSWTSAKVDREGVDVTAPLVGSDVLGSDEDPEYWISYRLPEDIDPRGDNAWPVQVERATYEQVRDTREVHVRVLRDEPAAAHVEGEVSHRAGLWSTLVVDALILALVLLFWRHRVRRGTDEAADSDSDAPPAPAGGA